MRKILYIAVLFLVAACGTDTKDPATSVDNFNRKEMLTFWANKIIIPGYTDFQSKTKTLKEATNTFTTTPNDANLTAVKNAWKEAYVTWQKVALFQVGKAAILDMNASLNTYPANAQKIDTYLSSGTYNLESPSVTVYASQGFPALDYLLYAKGAKGSETATEFFTKSDADGYHKQYLKDVVNRIHNLTTEVLNNWNTSYKNEFIEASGSSQTSSTDILVNYYIVPYYEKQYRDPKVANASGAKTGEPKVSLVEAYYKQDISKELLQTATATLKNLFQGKSYDGTEKGQSLQQYLEFLNRQDLVEKINANFENIETKTALANANFVTQIKDDKLVMLSLYDAIQAGLKTFKPDMFTALGVQNTSTDSDND